MGWGHLLTINCSVKNLLHEVSSQRIKEIKRYPMKQHLEAWTCRYIISKKPWPPESVNINYC